MPRRTKIVCSMGPACAGAVLAQLLAAGMNVARLDCDDSWHEQLNRRLLKYPAGDLYHRQFQPIGLRDSL